jgi:predicted NBD/HSP70 family sugar kinase
MTSPIVGVDVGGTSIRAVRFDGDATPTWSSAGPTPRGAAAIAGAIAEHVAVVGAGAAAVSIGMPGRVDAVSGVVRSAVNLGIDGPVPFAGLVSELVGRPVHVENDVNVAALGAFSHLRMAPDASLAYVNVGTGIAAGLVLGGRLWRGATGGAGEIGHIPMWPHGAPCPCGQDGCAEAVGSGRAVTTDPARRADVAYAVAWTVQLCVMTLDVDVVALGGGMTESGAVVTAVHAALAAREASSPMLADLGLASRVRVVPADAPLGSLGAVLAFTARSAAP